MPDRIAVTHVVLSLDVGGLERMVLDLVKEGRTLGQKVTVVCLERPGSLAPQAEADGTRVYCVAKTPGLRPEIIGKLASIFARVRPDVVHTHQIGALLYSGPAARRSGGVVVVHTEHGKHYARRLRTRIVGRWAARYASRFFCVSRDIAAEVRIHGIAAPRKIRVIPNGIDPGRFRRVGSTVALRNALGIPPDAPVIGTVGRLAEVKRQDVLLGAFGLLQAHRPDAHLLLVGDGPLMADLRQLAARLGLAERVHFAGYQAEPENYLQVMDVFALTSSSEGLPLSVLEAWAAGVPVVASAVGGVPELIDDGVNGLLFPSGDERALAAALSDLLSNPELARRLRDAGSRVVEAKYSLSRTANEYHRHYVELLAHRPQTAPVARN